MTAQGQVDAAVTLRRGRLSNSAVLFQSISQIAPAGGIATVAILGANFAGGALTLATIISVIACLLTALSVAQLAKYLPSAGSVGTYVARGRAWHPGVQFHQQAPAAAHLRCLCGCRNRADGRGVRGLLRGDPAWVAVPAGCRVRRNRPGQPCARKPGIAAAGAAGSRPAAPGRDVNPPLMGMRGGLVPSSAGRPTDFTTA